MLLFTLSRLPIYLSCLALVILDLSTRSFAFSLPRAWISAAGKCVVAENLAENKVQFKYQLVKYFYVISDLFMRQEKLSR